MISLHDFTGLAHIIIAYSTSQAPVTSAMSTTDPEVEEIIKALPTLMLGIRNKILYYQNTFIHKDLAFYLRVRIFTIYIKYIPC